MSAPDEIQKAHLLRASYETLLAETPDGELLARAQAILEGLAERDEESFAIWEAIARVLGNRVDGGAIQPWLADAAALGPGGSWIAARLATRGKHDPLTHWDRVVDRGTGPHLERHLSRARVRAQAGDVEGASADLREAFHHPADYREMERGAKLLKRLRKHELASKRQIKIGLLGGFTTQLIRPLLELACFRDGIDAEIYEAEFGMFRQEILDPASELRRFEPDVVILATSWRDANLAPTTDEPNEVAKATVDGFESLWSICAKELRAHVIQHNFDVPAVESYGQLSLALPGGRARTLLRTNLELLERAKSGVSILDFDGVAARFGKARWNDVGLWYRAKQHLAPEAVPELVDEYLMHIRALLGLSKKCLVLDLDNTVWGGVIGEDGLDGIELGGHSPEGEAHADLQRYAAELRGRGIVLAVCSKNNDADAREPFEKHPEMVLSLDDIAVFQANWQDKATNLREIAEALQLGLDSFVFLDDNPTERAWVRSQLPEVVVPEIGDEPSEYLPILQRYRLFDTLTLSDEDLKRASDYSANAARASIMSSAANMEEFLTNLEMGASIGEFDAVNLPRIEQLVNKSNQFNLTTRRYTHAELEAFAEDPRCITRWFRLRDRFADNGLIGVMLGRLTDDRKTLEIDLWLMSCRVLGRRMEELMGGEMMRAAREAGAERILGRYIPTAKNAMVAALYERLGFEPLDPAQAPGGADEGETLWVYDLTAKPIIENPFIQIDDR